MFIVLKTKVGFLIRNCGKLFPVSCNLKLVKFSSNTKNKHFAETFTEPALRYYLIQLITYRMEGNFGGCKLWRIWWKIVQPPILNHQCFPIH